MIRRTKVLIQYKSILFNFHHIPSQTNRKYLPQNPHPVDRPTSRNNIRGFSVPECFNRYNNPSYVFPIRNDTINSQFYGQRDPSVRSNDVTSRIKGGRGRLIKKTCIKSDGKGRLMRL